MIEIKDNLLENLETTLRSIKPYDLSNAELLKYHKLFMVTMKNDYGKLFKLLFDKATLFMANKITADEYIAYKMNLEETEFKHLSFWVFDRFCDIIFFVVSRKLA